MKGKAILLLLFIGAISCSVLENENNEPTYRWDKETLIVENGSSETLYYAVFEQRSLEVINWSARSSSENKLLPNTHVSINADDIYDYEDGDNLVLFYWKGKAPSYENLNSVVIK